MKSEALNNLIELMRDLPIREDATFRELREDMENFIAPFPLPDGTKVEPVDADGVPAEWLATPGADMSKTLLFLHGGGYVMGSINTHRAFNAGLSTATGARCLSLDYRLAPEHPFPAAIDDAVTGYRWLLSQNSAPDRIAICGDSAGGGLTIATLVALKNAGIPLPCAGVTLSPWTDLEGTGESMTTKADVDPMVQKEGTARMADAYLNGKDQRTPLASPLYADLHGLPPLLIQVGSAEILLDDSTRLAMRAKEAGVETEIEVWDDMIHVFQVFASMLPEGQQAIDKIGVFLKKQWG
jgi:monoterpene epsilon-lactone hydrolase